MPDSPNLTLPYLQASQAQKHITHNEAIKLLDNIVHLAVISRVLTAPPGSPADGDRYIVSSSATGLWAGWDLNVAFYADGAWTRLVPRPGWIAFDISAGVHFFYTGVAWQSLQIFIFPHGLLTTNPGTVGALPSGVAGARAIVTDSTQSLALGIGTALIGGGSNTVPTFHDGVIWVIG